MKRLWLVVLGASGLLIAGGSGAFSTSSADRPVSVSVVNDEDAYLGIERLEDDSYEASVGETVDVLTLTNRFSETLDIQVSTSANSLGVTSEDESIGPSEETTVTVSCDSQLDEQEVTLSFTGTAHDIKVTTDVIVTVECNQDTDDIEDTPADDEESDDEDTGMETDD